MTTRGCSIYLKSHSHRGCSARLTESKKICTNHDWAPFSLVCICGVWLQDCGCGRRARFNSFSPDCTRGDAQLRCITFQLIECNYPLHGFQPEISSQFSLKAMPRSIHFHIPTNHFLSYFTVTVLSIIVMAQSQSSPSSSPCVAVRLS